MDKIIIDAGEAISRGATSERAKLLGGHLRDLGKNLNAGYIASFPFWRQFVQHIDLPRAEGGYGGYLPHQLRKPKVRGALIKLAQHFSGEFGTLPSFLTRTPSYRLPPVSHRPEWPGGPTFPPVASPHRAAMRGSYFPRRF